ncbi:unnamed protein product [Rotaria magnacalcarata]|uniref:Uncharacterized protein n=1 Tax=Rotaria magnacalcarata TaxID=392030 RepID=A0A817ATV6_9BILA|nr:unnamed protein product [Rotaria magnacalcarata]
MKFLTANENDQLDAITKNELIRYDFTQLDLSYFTSDEDYTCDSTTAVWRARTIPLENPSTQLHSLQMITFENGTMDETYKERQMQSTAIKNLNTHNLMINSTSNDSIEQARAMMKNIDLRTDPPLNIPVKYQNFIWFLLPQDIFPV